MTTASECSQLAMMESSGHEHEMEMMLIAILQQELMRMGPMSSWPLSSHSCNTGVISFFSYNEVLQKW